MKDTKLIKLSEKQENEIIRKYLKSNKEKNVKTFSEIVEYLTNIFLYGGLAIGNITIAGMFSYLMGTVPSRGVALLLIVSMMSSILFSWMFIQYNQQWNKKMEKKYGKRK